MTGKKASLRVIAVVAIVAGACLAIAALIGLGASAATTFGAPRGAGAATTSGEPRGAVLGTLTVDQRGNAPLGGIGMVSVATVSERLRVIDGTGDQLQAWLHGTARGEPPRLVVERTPGGIDVRLERPRAIGPSWNDLVLEVSLPAGYGGRLAAKSVSGAIDLADHAYEGVALSSTSGEIRAGSVKAADFAMHSTSGALRAQVIGARQTDISSVSGEVEVTSLSGAATVRTTSGEVRLTFAVPPSRLDASSVSGRLSLTLPADAGFTLDAHSTSGEVTCEFPVTIAGGQSVAGRHALAGVVGGGVNAISASTVSGEIRIRR
jgi:lia operon protein LiaG